VPTGRSEELDIGVVVLVAAAPAAGAANIAPFVAFLLASARGDVVVAPARLDQQREQGVDQG